jgi:hypothetical protein
VTRGRIICAVPALDAQPSLEILEFVMRAEITSHYAMMMISGNRRKYKGKWS